MVNPRSPGLDLAPRVVDVYFVVEQLVSYESVVIVSKIPDIEVVFPDLVVVEFNSHLSVVPGRSSVQLKIKCDQDLIAEAIFSCGWIKILDRKSVV